MRCRRSDGSYAWLAWTVTPAVPGDARVYCVARDATALVAAEEQHELYLEAIQSNALALQEQVGDFDSLRIEAEYLADHDVLTGALNRRAWFRDAIDIRPVALAIVDIDYFKSVNDTYGHPAGDVVLAEVASRLAAAMGDCARVGRIGGEEFAIAFTGSTAEARDACERALDGVAASPITFSGGEASVNVSIGLSDWVAGDQLREEGLARAYAAADKALYIAKQSGRNRIVKAQEQQAA